ncbi:MAG: hypothetical protein CMO01_23220 [Thalassobius sp.]|nr:hypothetical protein [Thalassovita sp.]
MSLFDKLFKSDKEDKTKEQGFDKLSKKDWTSFNELFEHHAALSFEKQLLFGEVIGDNSWQFDMNTGTISFGSELSFPVQVIGSLSFNDSSWMWGWANTQSGIPNDLLLQSHQLKTLGEDKQVEELIDPHFTVDQNFEHKVGMIACGLFNAKSYYCANYGQGTLVVTIESDDIAPIDRDRVEPIMTKFPQLISSMELNHKNTFINYLIDRSFKVKLSENKVEGLRLGKSVVADFDEQDRLTNLNGNL